MTETACFDFRQDFGSDSRRPAITALWPLGAKAEEAEVPTGECNPGNSTILNSDWTTTGVEGNPQTMYPGIPPEKPAMKSLRTIQLSSPPLGDLATDGRHHHLLPHLPPPPLKASAPP